MGRGKKADWPTLQEAWAILAETMEVRVEDCGRRSVSVLGEVRGRGLAVDIAGKGKRNDGWRVLFAVNTMASRNPRERWRTHVSVSCSNPRRIVGVIESSVSVDNPNYRPGPYHPANGRLVTTTSPELAQVLTPDIHERLMSITRDLRIAVGERAIAIDEVGSGHKRESDDYMGGSFLHQPLIPMASIPMPERAVAATRWWIDLLCDLADVIDRSSRGTQVARRALASPGRRRTRRRWIATRGANTRGCGAWPCRLSPG